MVLFLYNSWMDLFWLNPSRISEFFKFLFSAFISLKKIFFLTLIPFETFPCAHVLLFLFTGKPSPFRNAAEVPSRPSSPGVLQSALEPGQGLSQKGPRLFFFLPFNDQETFNWSSLDSLFWKHCNRYHANLFQLGRDFSKCSTCNPSGVCVSSCAMGNCCLPDWCEKSFFAETRQQNYENFI